MRCSLCMHVSTDCVACVVCVGSWCVTCHQSLMRRSLDTALSDIDVALSHETREVGVSCPFCRHPFAMDALPNRLTADPHVVSMLDALSQCRTEIHANMTNETTTWLASNAEATRIERSLAEINADIDDVVQSIDRIEQQLGQLRKRSAEAPDRQSLALLREQIDRHTLEREWEWCQIGHLEAMVDEQLASYVAHCNIMQLQTGLQTTVVSDLLRVLFPQQEHRSNPRVQTWDELTSPVDFFTFLSLRIRMLHRQLDVQEFLRYLCGWFAQRNDLLYLVEEVRRTCRSTTGTGVRRWLGRCHTRRCVDPHVANDFHAYLHQCLTSRTG